MNLGSDSPPREPSQRAPEDFSAFPDAAGDSAAEGGDTLGRSAGLVGLATLISRILGFLRDVLIANFFGAALAADAFFVAFAIPSLLRRFFAEGALTSAFIPVFSQVRRESGEVEAQRFAGAIALGLGAALIIVCALGAWFAEPLVRGLAPGFAPNTEKVLLAARLTRVMFPFLFFIGLSAIAMGVLNEHRRFFLPALSPALHNVAMIAALLAAAAFAGGRPGAVWLAWGVVAGGVLQLAFQLPLMARRGLLPIPAAPWRAPGVGRCLSLMGPAALGIAVLQINVLADRWLASFLEEGSISYLYYANRLVQFPHGVLSLAVATAAFPVLSDEAASDAEGAIRRTLTDAGRLILLVTLPAAFGLIALADPIMEVLFERGAFGPAETAASAWALRAYSLGLIAFGGVRLLTGVYHARQNTRYPVRCANIAVLANLALSVALMFPLKFVGLALATSAASFLNLGLLIRGMREGGEGGEEGDWPAGDLGRALKRLAPLALAMGAGAYLLNGAIWPAGGSFAVRAGALCAEIALAAVFYLGLCRAFAPVEAAPLFAALRRRLARWGRAEGKNE